MKEPSFSPIYAASLYPELATVFQSHGYALAVHGSLQADLDLIAVPWAESVSTPEVVLSELLATWDFRLIGSMTPKFHGRLCQTIALSGLSYIDLSFVLFPGAGA